MILQRLDVRDMLCAQALAVVAKTLERTERGERIAVRYNAEDVKRDLLVWAADRGHIADEQDNEFLYIEKR